jgi:hypothetical protein
MEPLYRTSNGRIGPDPLDIEPEPIDMGPETDEVYLVLFGTGLRRRSALSTVTARLWLVDGTKVDLPVEYAGPQSEFAGLDQLNLKLPRTILDHRKQTYTGLNWLEFRVDGTQLHYNELALYVK